MEVAASFTSMVASPSSGNPHRVMEASSLVAIPCIKGLSRASIEVSACK